MLDKKFFLVVTVAATIISVMAVRPSDASSLNAGDHVYADSMGNLIVDSAAGYKRIIVGQGHRAEELRAFTAADGPQVIHADETADHHDDCYRPGLWLRGRSHMYGLSPGELPPLAACR